MNRKGGIAALLERQRRNERRNRIKGNKYPLCLRSDVQQQQRDKWQFYTRVEWKPDGG